MADINQLVNEGIRANSVDAQAEAERAAGMTAYRVRLLLAALPAADWAAFGITAEDIKVSPRRPDAVGVSVPVRDGAGVWLGHLVFEFCHLGAVVTWEPLAQQLGRPDVFVQLNRKTPSENHAVLVRWLARRAFGEGVTTGAPEAIR